MPSTHDPASWIPLVRDRLRRKVRQRWRDEPESEALTILARSLATRPNHAPTTPTGTSGDPKNSSHATRRERDEKLGPRS